MQFRTVLIFYQQFTDLKNFVLFWALKLAFTTVRDPVFFFFHSSLYFVCPVIFFPSINKVKVNEKHKSLKKHRKN